MKLRISENFLRFRLTRSEVELFGANGRIEAKVRFAVSPAHELIFELTKSPVERVSAEFANGKITVFVPAAVAENWVHGDDVGFEDFQKIDEQPDLRILVEKDFAFLKPKLEDDSDNFPHPLKSAAKI